jgi:hypothetical protein
MPHAPDHQPASPRLAATIAGEPRGFVVPVVAGSIGRALVSLCPPNKCRLTGVVVCPASTIRPDRLESVEPTSLAELEGAIATLSKTAQLRSEQLIVARPSPQNETPCVHHGFYIGLRREQCWRALQLQEERGWSFDWLAHFRMDVAFFDPENLLTPLNVLSRHGPGVYVPGNHARNYGLSTVFGWPISDHFAVISREDGAMTAFMPQHCSIHNARNWYPIPEDKLLYQLEHFNISIHRGFFPWVLMRESVGSVAGNRSVDAECFRHRACCVMLNGTCQGWPPCPSPGERARQCQTAFLGHACMNPTMNRTAHRCPVLV